MEDDNTKRDDKLERNDTQPKDDLVKELGSIADESKQKNFLG